MTLILIMKRLGQLSTGQIMYDCLWVRDHVRIFQLLLHPKSLYISHAVSNLYGTEIERLVLGRLAILKKKWAERIFHVFMGKIIEKF